ncbi:helix-turn-helix transcriptional regulator [Streptomyces sp. DSM 40907]|uniref:helix-turn-helix transcriptional regulator n=1 Tax=Streptomyces kutzneri TaxID=3051179 RepID=UPI0028D38FA8|nr:helix-turn-helix transcriptional regulator [Streptomyces sp. DSM 40907]
MTQEEDPVPPDRKIYATTLGKLYKSSGISQAALARHLRIDPSTVSRWFSGKDGMVASEAEVTKTVAFLDDRGITVEESQLAELRKLRKAAQKASGTVRKTADRLAEHEAEIERALRRHLIWRICGSR